ncbi:hypothetical protein HPO96_28510 [Kribbella sandramycini]|nr:hypothetical protein [Kribbella sandramycini]
MPGWRVIGRGPMTWFERPSLSAGAELAQRVAAAGVPAELDLRPTGVRVRVADAEAARRVSAVAGAEGDPTGLQELRIVIDAVHPARIQEFWAMALDDDPRLAIRPTTDIRPLRNRFHVDVVRPASIVEAARGDRTPTGPWGVMLADDEGNELDLVPGDPLAPEAADWHTLFAAMVFYPTTQAVELATTVADLADLPLMIDLRPDGVLIHHGKDAWEQAGRQFVELAVQIQNAAHALGLAADPARPRFVQIGIDAVDVPAIHAFWTTALGYTPDPRWEAGDSFDPRGAGPGLIFQQMQANDVDRRAQRNRIRIELGIPHDQLAARVEQAVAAGGQLSADRRTVIDPEGNELVFSPAFPQ